MLTSYHPHYPMKYFATANTCNMTIKVADHQIWSNCLNQLKGVIKNNFQDKLNNFHFQTFCVPKNGMSPAVNLHVGSSHMHTLGYPHIKMKGVFVRNFEEKSLKVPDSRLVGFEGPTVGITTPLKHCWETQWLATASPNPSTWEADKNLSRASQHWKM